MKLQVSLHQGLRPTKLLRSRVLLEHEQNIGPNGIYSEAKSKVSRPNHVGSDSRVYFRFVLKNQTSRLGPILSPIVTSILRGVLDPKFLGLKWNQTRTTLIGESDCVWSTSYVGISPYRYTKSYVRLHFFCVQFVFVFQIHTSKLMALVLCHTQIHQPNNSNFFL